MTCKPVNLPKLPYDYSALEPVISAAIMETHYSKHHQAYVTNLNKALEQYAEAEEKSDLSQMIVLESAIRFNGGGHINHSLFWENLAPKSQGGGTPPKEALRVAIDKKFGSFEQFVEEFNAKTLAIQGSGWGWLGYHRTKGCMCIRTTANQDPLATQGLIPLLGIDVWEHAYYLQYKNMRGDYLKAIWNVVNWSAVEKRFLAAQ